MLLREMIHLHTRISQSWLILTSVITLTALPLAAQSSHDTLTIYMNPLEDIVVSAPVIQASISHQELGHAQLNQDNAGQNLPYLLQSTPSMVVTSDDGLGIGYTYFHIRGTDQTRINVTMNDVPLNDQESQSLFWVNLTDMSSGINSLQVQRGVGTSANGGSSFGASVNIRTGSGNLPDRQRTPWTKGNRPVQAEIDFNGGMYNTFREMVKADVYLGDANAESGAWHISGRFSKVNSDGYIERAFSDLLSYQGEIGWQNNKSAVRLQAFGGKERTYMAWYGIDATTLATNRRYNPAGEYIDADGNIAYYDNQTDNYQQHHVHLHIGHRFNNNWSLSATGHYTYGTGYFEMYDQWLMGGIVQRGLRNHFYGGILSTKFIDEHVDLQMGIALNNYQGQQYGTIDTLLTGQHFDNYMLGYGNKVDGSVYAKSNWHLIHRARERLSLYCDLQYRMVDYRIWGDNEEATMPGAPVAANWHYTWHFFNPKAGITYDNHGHRVSATFALAHREPTRNNFVTNIADDDPQPEKMQDYELGYTYSSPGIFSNGYTLPWTAGVNLYVMNYDNQLITTGDITSVGYLITTNVKRSYRAGLELQLAAEWTKWLDWHANLTWSRNRWLDKSVWRTISFAPDWTMSNSLVFHVAGFSADVQTQVVSSQYLSNTEDATAMLKPYTVTNLQLRYRLPFHLSRHADYLPDCTLKCSVNNLFNTDYISNGGTDGTYVWFFPQAGINVHAGFTVLF